MFINFTNHKSDKWSQEQLLAAKELARGEIIDLPFPNIDPRATKGEVVAKAYKMAEDLYPLPEYEDIVILVQGEMTFVHNFIREMDRLSRDLDIEFVAATSERVVVETVNPDGTTSKSSEFRFVQFRSY